MFVEHNFFVGARDINSLKELTNTALLSYLEDVACIHSEIAGYGITNMYTIKKTWILLSWKIKVIERPKFSDNLKVKTWSRLIDKFYAYRDFEVYDENNTFKLSKYNKTKYFIISTCKLISSFLYKKG